ncbi:MAG: type II toxin-antitoxin system VapC family toxin [Alphaproteobacteria bacterium]|nr:type II toxin-antitoxin system VapC family toxin [Alphaproteobacteria bacterium]
MTARYLLDTNICIYIRQRRPPLVMERFRRLAPGEAVLSVITFGELLYGAEKSAERASATEKLRQLVELIPVMPLPEDAAASYAAQRAALERKGRMIGNNDLWIAAHALAAGLILVTNDERELGRVSGLKVENWSRE